LNRQKVSTSRKNQESSRKNRKESRNKMSTILAAIVAALIAAANVQATIVDCGGSSSVIVASSSVTPSGTSATGIDVAFSLEFKASSISGPKLGMSSWTIAAYTSEDPTVDICKNYITCAVTGTVQASGSNYIASGSYTLTSALVSQLPGFLTTFKGNNTVQVVVTSGTSKVLCADLTFALTS